MSEEEKDWIIILVCDNIPNQKFWDGSDWTTDVDKAKLHPTYGSTFQTIWIDISDKVLEKAQKEAETKYPKIKVRITSLPIHTYKKLLNKHSDESPDK